MFEDSYFYKHGQITVSDLAGFAEWWQDDPIFFLLALFVTIIMAAAWALMVWWYLLLFIPKYRAMIEAQMEQRITPLGMYILFMVIWGFGMLMNHVIFSASPLSYVLHSILGNTLYYWLGQIQWSFFSLGILGFIF